MKCRILYFIRNFINITFLYSIYFNISRSHFHLLGDYHFYNNAMNLARGKKKVIFSLQLKVYSHACHYIFCAQAYLFYFLNQI